MKRKNGYWVPNRDYVHFDFPPVLNNKVLRESSQSSQIFIFTFGQDEDGKSILTIGIKQLKDYY